LYSTGYEQLGKWLTYEALRNWLPYKKEIINIMLDFQQNKEFINTLFLIK